MNYTTDRNKMWFCASIDANAIGDGKIKKTDLPKSRELLKASQWMGRRICS
jgi:hypothetical protein